LGEHYSMATPAAALGVGDTVLLDGEWVDVTGTTMNQDTQTITLTFADGSTAEDVEFGTTYQRSLGLLSEC
jgi:hypothetical protein